MSNAHYFLLLAVWLCFSVSGLSQQNTDSTAWIKGTEYKFDELIDLTQTSIARIFHAYLTSAMRA
jgi:hypothetical protein